MTCTDYRSLLHDWLDGTLTPAQAVAMENHARECSDCAAERDALAAWQAACTDMTGEVPVPAEAAAAWRQAIREEAQQMQAPQTQAPKRKGFKTHWKAWAGVAAAVMFVVVGTIATRNQNENGSMNYAPQIDSNYDAGGFWAAEEAPAPQLQMSKAAAPQAVYGAAESGSEPQYQRDEALTGIVPAPEGEAFRTDAATADQDPRANLHIIRTAYYALETLRFDEDLATLDSLTNHYQGWAASRSITGKAFTEEGGRGRTARLTLRIPADQLDAFLQGVAGTGQVLESSQYAEDISDSYYDVQGRLKSAEMQRDHLQALIGSTGRLADLLALEAALAEVQTTIDRLSGNLRHWDSQVSYSEVELTLTETRETTRVRPPDPSLGQRLAEVFFDSLNGVVEFLSDMLLFVVASGPWLALLLVAGVALGLVIRRVRRRKKAHKPTPSDPE